MCLAECLEIFTLKMESVWLLWSQFPHILSYLFSLCLKNRRRHRNLHSWKDKGQLISDWWEWEMMSFLTKDGCREEHRSRKQNQRSYQNSLNPTVTKASLVQLHSSLWTCMNLQIIKQLHVQKQEDILTQTQLFCIIFHSGLLELQLISMRPSNLEKEIYQDIVLTLQGLPQSRTQ